MPSQINGDNLEIDKRLSEMSEEEIDNAILRAKDIDDRWVQSAISLIQKRRKVVKKRNEE